MWQKGRQTWIRTTAYSRIQAKKQGSVQFSRLAFRMDFKGGENPFLMAREGHRKPPRHPSVRNIAKSGKGHFTGFSGRKSENIGLLWAKVRMFCLEKSDVFEAKTTRFRAFFIKNTRISKEIESISPIFRKSKYHKLTSQPCKTPKNSPIFTLEGSRKIVKIFEGFGIEKKHSECMFWGRFWDSVQFSQPRSEGLLPTANQHSSPSPPLRSKFTFQTVRRPVRHRYGKDVGFANRYASF